MRKGFGVVDLADWWSEVRVVITVSGWFPGDVARDCSTSGLRPAMQLRT